MVVVSSSVVSENAYEQLTNTVRGNLSGISKENGNLTFSEDFSFTKNGVHTVVYSSSGAMLAGQLPLSFPDTLAFETARFAWLKGITAVIMCWISGCRSAGMTAYGCAV